ncbi:hypothetical protein Apmu_0130_28 [Acidiphilium multivorum AIU301]|nr:hypothetical protein Apmu_0130_28 [Acidiphilium multivorum AIU301]
MVVVGTGCRDAWNRTITMPSSTPTSATTANMIHSTNCIIQSIAFAFGLEGGWNHHSHGRGAWIGNPAAFFTNSAAAASRKDSIKAIEINPPIQPIMRFVTVLIAMIRVPTIGDPRWIV